ncbi:hypothetical protein EV688_110112 [Chromatocurvus halotolerans]|uniref:Uncharacterized protein n=1 Tax=Chromatocurvus halotolerans TaxID=1132028 RepID=A0A4R2KR22_9GAMM|nr:hypothetical protein EV688_110112 [Chromatocurvus halotolerans]
MPQPSMIFFLAAFTFAAVITYSIWQIRRARKAKLSGEQPALGNAGENRS